SPATTRMRSARSMICLPGATSLSGWLRRPAYRFSRRSAYGFLARAAAQLLAQHLGRHLLDRAAAEVAELKRAVGEADQPRYRIAVLADHPPHLAVLALLQRQGDPGVRPLLTVERGADRAVIDAVDADAFLQRGEPRRFDHAMHTYPVPTHPTGGRQFE